MSLFIKGRKHTYHILEDKLKSSDKVIWVHTASLGEFEQGLPIIEALKKEYTNYKILVSFFSPSGYEIKKDTTAADAVVYLPLDTQTNAKKFIKAAHPSLAIFIKYEIWPNYFAEIKANQIPLIVASAIFKEKQIYFKSYGGYMKKALTHVTHFFVQNTISKTLLQRIGLNNVTISGDTRFDRVSKILERDNRLSFMDSFTEDHRCLVFGSSWPEDEAIFIPYINQNTTTLKYVIAPHNIKPHHIQSLKEKIQKKVICFSELQQQPLQSYNVLIIDTIGLLTKIYSYADIAYVGGGFKTGLHNTLEPAVFGIPIIIGPHFNGFNEAEELVEAKGIKSIISKDEFTKHLNILLEQSDVYQKTCDINKTYVQQNLGATTKIVSFIKTQIS